MKVVTHNDIKNLNITPSSCYDWVSEMIFHKKDVLLPAKIHMALPEDVFCNIMPSIINKNVIGNTDCSIGGVKIVSRYPKREPSLDSKLLLFNADSGEILSIMDANWITAMRTGAVAAHSVINLAKKDFSTISIIGLGNTARAFMLVLSSVITNKIITVKLMKYKDQADLFKERFEHISNINFVTLNSTEELIRDTDVIVSCATYFENDIAKDEWFDEGVLVVPVHTRGFTNCDLFFDKVFADDTAHVDHFKNFSKFRYYAEMTDVVNGLSRGRENDRERILAYNIGVSVHDIYYAAKIYDLLKQDTKKFNELQNINMEEPIEKFWV